MHLPDTPSNQPSDVQAADRRNRGRLRTELLETPFGRVVDLSVTGLRVEGRGRVRLRNGEVIFLLLRGIDDEVRVKAEVVWAKQTSFFRFAVGFRFLELEPTDMQHLAHIAQNTVKKVFLDRKGRTVVFNDWDE